MVIRGETVEEAEAVLAEDPLKVEGAIRHELIEFKARVAVNSDWVEVT